MDQKELIRQALTAREPACLHDLLVRHCAQFDPAVAQALKGCIDAMNRANPAQALAFAQIGLSAAEDCSKAVARAWMLWARAHAQMQLED
jgi:hypothetical protein